MASYLVQSSLPVAELGPSGLLPFSFPVASVDTLILEGEGSLGIDLIKNIKSFLISPPLKHTHKFVLIPQAERLTLEAQTALLKTLEEPPPYAQLVLITPQGDSLLPTIISRCYLVRDSAPHQSTPSEKSILLDALNSSLAIKPGSRLTRKAALKYTRLELLKDLAQTLGLLSLSLEAQPDPNNLLKAQLAWDSYQAVSHNANLNLSLDHLFLHWPQIGG